MSSKDHSVTDEDIKIGVEEKPRDAQIEETSSFVALEQLQEEKRLVRKLDVRILPIACFLYLFAYLDRSNLGNARLLGLPEDALGGDADGKKFDWVNSVFFISYILCQVPATVLSKLVKPHFWMAGSAMGWGMSSTLMAAAFNFGGLMTCRVFLGIFESGFGPAIPLYFSFFYTKTEIGLRMAYWFGFAAVAGAFGGLLAFGLQHSGSSVQHWKLLFVTEGLPTVTLGLISLCFLPDRPESTNYLTERERAVAVQRMNRATSGDIGMTVNRDHIFRALKDWRIYIGGVVYFGLNCALTSISAFLPTILQTLGNSDGISQLLTVPPYAVAAVVLVGCAWVSDRMQTRWAFMVCSSLLGVVGYIILLAVPDNNHARYFATFCITSGTYTTIGLIIAWFAHNLGSETKRATGIPMFMAIGQCGSILGSHIFPKNEGPRYIKGFAVSLGLEALGAICILLLTMSYKMDNAWRDREYGKPEPDAKVDTKELADKAPTFRYVV